MAERPLPLAWQEAKIAALTSLTPRVKSVRLQPKQKLSFLAGQHVDIRLTAPDGYSAQRSYSIASLPGEEDSFELCIERLEGGEVSPFFHEVAALDDEIEFRGPIGGHFIWRPEDGGPLLLLAGGSGLVPLLSMLRQRAKAAPEIKTALLYSARNFMEVIHADELMRREETEENFSLHLALTRDNAPPPGHHVGRIDQGLVNEALAWLGAPKRAYVCGANGFVETACQLLIGQSVAFEKIRAERYGGA